MKTAAPRRAFSLIEVIVALAVLTVGVYGLIDVVGSSRHSAFLAHWRLQCVSLGRLKLEELRAAGPELASYMASAPANAKGEVLYPLQGPKPLQRGTSLLWQAVLKRNPENPRRLDIRIMVSSPDRERSPEMASEVRGFAFIPSGDEKK